MIWLAFYGFINRIFRHSYKIRRKAQKNREELKKGMEDGITVKEIGHQVISKDLYQEAIILSDMYDINEFVALDLLCTAQMQMPYYYGLPRGLVAVLLYYDGRKCITSSLRLLVQAHRGVSWSINASKDVIDFITIFTDELVENGLFNRIFELLRTLDVSKEIEKLQENLALGGPRHRRQVIDLFNDIKQCLSEIVFLWSAQCGLPKEPTLSLINFMCELKIEETSLGIVDNVTFYLLMALLSVMDLSIMHIREDGEEVVQRLPILADKTYVPMLHSELSLSKPKWVSDGLQAVAIFGFSVTTSCLRLLPQVQEFQSIIDKTTSLLTMAIDMKVFQFLMYKVLANEILYTDEVLQRRIHYLFTDFIVQLFPKVRELRLNANESSRVLQVYAREGIDPPTTLPNQFEDFMKAITMFYNKDPLKLHYSLDYWCPIENSPNDSYSYRSPPRSVCLFKFIRLAGDSIPFSLYVPFVNMLSSLSTCQQAARHCFNMLKQSVLGNSFSWDHFFMSFSQYYINLKQEIPPVTDTVYRRGIHHKGITPQEIQGLRAVLNLIKTVAEFDDFSRLALCEHPGWSPLTILLGLVGCSVPLSLKAELLNTLAALSKSPETALQMWNNLEASQILITVPTTSSYQPRGIQTELDEIESRMEKYPLTQSLLNILDVLTDSGIPRTLGAGPRKPGFDPYLTFIVNSVFLKFNARSYKNPEERWIISAMCLKLLEKFLNQYEPQVSDFVSNEFNSPPGYHLMLQLNTKSEFLNLILYIIEEGNKLFLQYTSFAGKKFVEECTLMCLNIIDRALVLQGTFTSLMSGSMNPVLLTNLNKLLLNINPHTAQPDFCLNIAKYISHQYLLPKHALAAIKILVFITRSPALHSQFLNILLSNDKDARLIRSGVVECLDAPITKEESLVLIAVKETILKLLKQCLSFSVPNLSNFFLGFNLKGDISHTLFQQPGVLNFPRTCLHSLFNILQNSEGDTLRESAYHTLYLLCSNYKTSEPVLRFLRQNQKFFQEHLNLCLSQANDSISQLNQLSWLLKTFAIELKITCNSNQMFYLQELYSILVKLPENITKENEKIDSLLIDLLHKFDLQIQEVITPRWDYFDSNMLYTLINSCQTDSKPKLINIKMLHHTLIDEISKLHANTAIGQRQVIMQEIQKVLLHALNINNTRNTSAAINKFMDSWRQVVEVLAIYLPFRVFPARNQQFVNIKILQNLCIKVSNINLLPDIGNLLSGAALVLMENIWRCHLKYKEELKPDNMVCLPNGESLKLILGHLIDWIITNDGISQFEKINLYATLVMYLKITNDGEPGKNIQFYSSFYATSSKFQPTKEAMTYNFLDNGEKLIELLCRDCISGHDVNKMLAMTSFSMLTNMNGNFNWILHFVGHGYLKHIIENILNSDEELKSVLEPVPQNLRPMYLYVSKLSLLSQLATTRAGSELLLEQRILSCLSNMQIFQRHPEMLKQTQIPAQGFEDFIPSVENRYLQIFLPTLRLCNSIITSLSADNQSAVGQIIYYLISHFDVVEYVLRSGNPALSLNFLEELSLLTSILARITTSNMVFIDQSTDNIQDIRAHLYSLQKLMLELLPKFLFTPEVLLDLLSNPLQTTPTFQTSQRLLSAFQIISNLLMYIRNLISRNDKQSNVHVIFQPTLGNIFIKFNNKDSNDKALSLGVIVQHLINAVNYYHDEKLTLDFLQRKVNDIPNISSADLKELMKGREQPDDIVKAREDALELLNNKLNNKKLEFDHCSFIIDNTLYLLWNHLDYYMLRAIPKIKHGVYPDLSKTFNMNVTLASASEATWKVSTDDISSLKQGLAPIFNDSFSKRLLETATGRSHTSQKFIEILLRKIKRLIQFVPVK